jgi:imidazoleglycerol-phosphate dehydratase
VAAIEREDEAGRARVRLDVTGAGGGSVSTGIPVLDHLLTLSARHGGFQLAVEVAPGAAAEEAETAGRAVGEALAAALRSEGAAGHGSAHVPAAEALALVALEISESPQLVSNVDLSASRVGGLGTDVVSRFLHSLAEGAGLTLHVRLVEGEETEHVLEAIFKALGVALGNACSRRP